MIRRCLTLSVLFGLLPFLGHAQEEESTSDPFLFNPVFENIAIEQGLSNFNVSSICQDSLGYLWIGTARGLNRYDGSTFKQFLFSPDGDLPGIPYNFIDAVIHCRNHIFVNTRNGSAVYNLKRGAWHSVSDGMPVSDMMEIGNRAFFIMEETIFEYNFQLNKLEKYELLEHLKITRFIPSDDKRLWGISGDLKQVYSYEFQSNEVVANDLGDAIPIQGAFHEIIDQTLFLSTESGLEITSISPDGRILNGSAMFSEFKASSLLSFFLSVERWDADRVLICSFEQGLHYYDLRSGKLTNIKSEDSGLDSKLLKKLFKDRDGNLWVGTFDKGIEVFFAKQNDFNFDRQLNSLSHEEFVNSITWNDYINTLVLGTRTQGVLSSDEGFKNLINSKLRPLDIDNVISLFVDSEQKMWIGAYDKLVIFDQKKKSMITPQDYLNLKHIQHISEKDGFIYLVSNQGFYIYSLEGRRIKHIFENVSGGNQILHLPEKSILCSEHSGLYAYERNLGTQAKLSLHKDGLPFDLEGAVCMQQESDTILWIGTLSWGLIRLNLASLNCKSYTLNDGLPGNDVTAIEFDKNGRMWLSTSDGISCMYSQGNFNNFSSHEGIGNYQFHRRSSFSDQNGIIYFGGNNGLSYFDPLIIKLNEKFQKEILFQELIVNDSRVESGDNSRILNNTLPFSNEIVFTHRVTNFSIDYSALEFYAHDQLLFSHMLEGWDTRWQLPNKSHNVNYSNLPPGNYTLLVRARRSSGEWSDQSRLRITIKPAPWKTWWAYTAYFLAFISIVFLIFSLRFRNQVFKSNLEAGLREREREREINEMKIRFFTNISHEFRTPLSVINGVTSLISKNVEFEGYAKELFSSLNLNVDRLIRLINQLLTFRELESDTLNLAIRLERIDKIIEQTCKALSNYAQVKKITLVNGFAASVNELLCDADKIEKILSNLISNAIKYTPEGGRIIVMGKIRSKEDALMLYSKLKMQSFPLSESGYLEITIRDNGKGIKKKNLESVFKRYSKAGKPAKEADYSSSGIGLNFVKRLIVVHKGDIRVESTHKHGSDFSIILPLDKDIYSEEQRIIPSVSDFDKPVLQPPIPIQAGMRETEKLELLPKYKIAVIEDDVELCKLLTDTLSNLYTVCYAHDGKSGLDEIRKEKPDLVISDIMMPEMNGMELCHEIKQDEALSHVIVILLSAKSEISNQIEGLSRGADLYIPKPFNLDYLLTVISSQIQIRDKIHNSYLKGMTPELHEAEANQEVIQFLSRFNSLLEKELSNEDLSVDLLSEKMNMGRSSFYKKFTAITNTSPNVYIAKYRLNKSEELLRMLQYTVTEVSDLTGFRNASYFSTLFKKEKGLTPREFIKSLKEKQGKITH